MGNGLGFVYGQQLIGHYDFITEVEWIYERPIVGEDIAHINCQ